MLGEGCIYLLINLVNDKKYVGKDKSGDPENHRWKHHIRMASVAKPRLYVHRGIKAAGGPGYFSAEIIWRGPIELLNEKEAYYIKKLHSFVDDPLGGGYNLTRGGDGAGIMSAQTKQKMSKAAWLRWANMPWANVPQEAKDARRRAQHEGQKPYIGNTPEARAARAGWKRYKKAA